MEILLIILGLAIGYTVVKLASVLVDKVDKKE